MAALAFIPTAPPYQTTVRTISSTATGQIKPPGGGAGVFEVAIGQRLAHLVRHIHESLRVAQRQVALVGQG
jgi:hypothetical protein